MKTKNIFVVALLFTSFAQAALFRCSYVAEACDDKNDHYSCYAYGVGPNPYFCSEYDQSISLTEPNVEHEELGATTFDETNIQDNQCRGRADYSFCPAHVNFTDYCLDGKCVSNL